MILAFGFYTEELIFKARAKKKIGPGTPSRISLIVLLNLRKALRKIRLDFIKPSAKCNRLLLIHKTCYKYSLIKNLTFKNQSFSLVNVILCYIYCLYYLLLILILNRNIKYLRYLFKYALYLLVTALTFFSTLL